MRPQLMLGMLSYHTHVPNVFVVYSGDSKLLEEAVIPLAKILSKLAYALFTITSCVSITNQMVSYSVNTGKFLFWKF